MFDGYTLPAEQFAEISASIEALVPTPELISEIKSTSVHVIAINNKVQEMIGAKYSLADEIKLLRTAPSPEMEAYNAYAEECRAWGRAEKAKLGL